MKTTEILVKEHDNILKVLGRLGVLLKGDLNKNSDELYFILDFIENYSDKYHHMKEEDIYFEWISKNSEGLKSGPVSCMLKEHVTFRDLTSNAKNALNTFVIDNSHLDAQETVVSSLLMFKDLLSSHIEKENGMLYPMADRLNEEILNGDDLMLEKFNEIEKEYSKEIEKFENYCNQL